MHVLTTLIFLPELQELTSLGVQLPSHLAPLSGQTENNPPVLHDHTHLPSLRTVLEEGSFRVFDMELENAAALNHQLSRRMTVAAIVAESSLSGSPALDGAYSSPDLIVVRPDKLAFWIIGAMPRGHLVEARAYRIESQLDKWEREH